MKISNHVYVITGGGNGMGRELVLNILKKGGKVAAVDIRKEALDETKSLSGELSQNLSLHQLDLSNRKEVEQLPEQVIAIHGQVDAIVNNAGIIQPFIRVKDLEYSDIDRVMNVNFYGLLFMIKSFLPYLTKRPEGQIVNISSMGGFLPVPGQSIYGASKAAVKLLTEGLYAELMNTKISVCLVFPGAIKTHISENSGVAAPDLPEGTSQDDYPALPAPKAAEEIVKGMLKNKPRIFVGSDSKMLNKLYRLAPGFATRFISKKMKDLLK